MRDGGLYTIIPKYLPKFHWQRMELGAVSNGVPDFSYCQNGIEGWVECKAAKNGKIDINPFQIGWINHRLRFGGRVFVAVRSEDSEALHLFNGTIVHDFKPRIIENDQHLRLTSGGKPRDWDWFQIEKILLGDTA